MPPFQSCGRLPAGTMNYKKKKNLGSLPHVLKYNAGERQTGRQNQQDDGIPFVCLLLMWDVGGSDGLQQCDGRVQGRELLVWSRTVTASWLVDIRSVEFMWGFNQCGANATPAHTLALSLTQTAYMQGLLMSCKKTHLKTQQVFVEILLIQPTQAGRAMHKSEQSAST